MPEPVIGMRSHLPGIIWPAIPTQRGALVMSVLFQLARTEWWEPDRLLEHQLLQLGETLKHAYNTVPFYRKRFDAIGFRPGSRLTLDRWRELPLLTRRDIQDAGPELYSQSVPAAFGEIAEGETSGSTGEPVKFRGTQLDRLIWEAMTIREHQWHRRDLTGKLASIRAFSKGVGEPPYGTLLNDWGPPTNELYVTGPCAVLSLTADIGAQANWLMQQEPDYLLTYPTNLMALIRHFSAGGDRLRRLRGVRTVGETVPAELRAACRDVLGVALVDIYSSKEVNYIALQCPENEHYHVMGESALVEVIDSDGRPSGPGEVGRLVVSKLHNFAMPLVRYELRDYAEMGAPCPCGRGLPTLARIIGRSRNMLMLPSGEQTWPLVGFAEYREIAPIRQYQLIQHTLTRIEVRLVVDRPLIAAEEARLTRVIRAALGYPFELDFVYMPGEIPRARGGKFEEFVSLLDPMQ